MTTTSEIQKADPATRRHAVLITVGGAAVGTLLVVWLEWYRAPLGEWLRSSPEQLASRMWLVFATVAACMAVPLVAFAVHLWLLGGRVVSAQRFPPEGYRVVRDTPVLEGRAAVSRGRRLEAVAGCLVLAFTLLLLLVWRLAAMLGESLGGDVPAVG